MSSVETIDIKTRGREEMIDITALVRAAIRRAGVDGGLACVFVPHTTAAVTIQENTDPDVRKDMVSMLARIFPRDAGYAKREDNSDAHIKSSAIGASLTLIVDQGKPVLGPWQALYFCEFDGPRTRKVHVRVVG